MQGEKMALSQRKKNNGQKFWDSINWAEDSEEQITAHVNDFVQENADIVNIRDSSGVTPLINAIRHNHTNLVKRLLELNARVNTRTIEQFGSSTLLASASRGMLELCKILISKGANINAVNKKGVTSLMAAADEGHADVVKLLLDNGAQIDRGEGGSERLRLWALSSGNKKTIDLVLMAIKKEAAKTEIASRIERRKQIKEHQDEIKRHKEALDKVYSGLLKTTPERHELAEHLNRMRKEFGHKAKAYLNDSSIIRALRQKVYGR